MIRALRYRDLAAIDSIHRVSKPDAFEWQSGLSTGWPSTQGTFWGAILPARSDHSFVLEEGGQIWGFIQVRPRSSYDKWEIIRLVATTDKPYDVWAKLLEYVCVAAGNRRATKLFATVPDDAEELEIFRQLGFYRFACEDSLSLPISQPQAAPALPASMRPAEPRDAFPVLQLYAAITPRNVQQAEGLTSRDFEPPAGRLNGWLYRFGLSSDSIASTGAWVAEADGKIFAWFRLRWREGRCRMSFLLHPERRDAFPELRDYVVGVAKASRPCILGVQVRDYQQELVALFEDAGFGPTGRSLLLVKHIAVQVLERRLAPVLTRA